MEKLSVEQALLRAAAHLRKGELDSARAIYDAVLEAFPKNVRAQQGLARLNEKRFEARKNQSPPKEKINMLIARYNQGYFQALVDEAKLVLSEYSSSFVVWNLIGAAHAALGQFEEAEVGFRKAAELNPAYAKAYFNMGIALKEQGKFDQAIAAYQRALEIDPTDVDVPFNMGNALKGLGKLNDAIAAYRRALEIKPTHAETWNNMGNALRDQGKIDEAIAAYRRALEIKPAQADTYFNMGNVQKSLGALDEAIASFRRAVEIMPAHTDAYNNMGNALKGQGKLDDAIAAYRRAIEIKPTHAETWSNMGNALKDQGRLDVAIDAYKRALEIKPAYADAYFNLGNALKDQGRLDEAIDAYQNSIKIQPAHADAHNNMGNALSDQGKLDEAIAAYRRALEINPDYVGAHNNMGNALKEQGRLDAAIDSYKRALKINPADADAHSNIGNALKEQGNLDAAIDAYQRALYIKPAQANVYYNMGNALSDQGKLEEAIAAYRRAVEISPTHADAYINMGVVLKELGMLDEAISAYLSAVEFKPTHADAYNNMGNALCAQGKFDEAIANYRRAIEVKPAYAEAYNNMGNALKEQGRLDEAIAAYRRALEIKPAYAAAEGQLLHQQQHICDFSIAEKLYEASSRLGIGTEPVSVFSALSWADNPKNDLLRAIHFAAKEYNETPLSTPARPRFYPARIKIGYLSADFYDHATLRLMAGLLRSHDRNAFEVFAYSYGRATSEKWRTRIEKDVDHFFDVTDNSDRQIVDAVKSHNLDIAIDLKGYTQNTRSRLFQYRLAPIQINFLGYPGTMGANFIDYIIADPVVISGEQRQFYSERVIYLPHSYQPNDNRRLIAETITSRADFNLPENSFVFCCFNNSYKIGAAEFKIWMRILAKVNGSVLWLLRANKWAETNLRKEAANCGLDPSRIIFASKLPHAEHLARHKHADLFIDTFNINAHTTASDALWSGLPIVTKSGQKFAARVAASLLTAIGLPELITKTEGEYEQLILDLSMNSTKINDIRAKLAENRLKAPLFDTDLYTRDFERGLTKAYARYFKGLPPDDILVDC